MAIWLRFKQEHPVNKIINDAAHAGLRMIGMSFRLPGNLNDNGIRFGFASLSEEDVAKAVDILTKLTS